MGLDMLLVKTKIGRKGVLYLPIDVRRALGVEEGSEILIIVRNGEAIIRPLKSIFIMGAEARRISEISIEEFECESEALQEELYGSKDTVGF